CLDHPGGATIQDRPGAATARGPPAPGRPDQHRGRHAAGGHRLPSGATAGAQPAREVLDARRRLGTRSPVGRRGSPRPAPARHPARGRRDAHRPQGRPDRQNQRGKPRRQGTGGRGPRSSQAPRERSRRADPARLAAWEALRAVEKEDAYANLVLPPLLRARNIRGRDAAFATELTYGTLRLKGRYDAIIAAVSSRGLDRLDAPLLDALRIGAHQIFGMRVPDHAAVSATVALVRQEVGAG